MFTLETDPQSELNCPRKPGAGRNCRTHRTETAEPACPVYTRQGAITLRVEQTSIGPQPETGRRSAGGGNRRQRPVELASRKTAGADKIRYVKDVEDLGRQFYTEPFFEFDDLRDLQIL